MKKILLLCFPVSMTFAQTAGKKVPDVQKQIKICRDTPPYDSTEKQTFPAFTYQPASDPRLTDLREVYNLDSVAGKGTETEKAIRLLDWFHRQIPHQDVLPVSILTAQDIIGHYKTTKEGQGCYPLAIGMNEVFLSMGFRSRTVICFSSLYPEPHGGHVINSVYIDSLKKWIYMDPQENAYIKDEKGNFLSIEQVRERLIDGRPLILNATANYHGTPTKKEEYLYTFMAEHLYRVICPLNSEYNSQTRSSGKLLQYVELLPKGSVDPTVDGFETSMRNNYQVITYHTNNNILFWQKP